MRRTNTEQKKKKERNNAPLAARIRPRALDELFGHKETLGPGTALRKAIEQSNTGSLILWGPPGIGKTTLAYIIAANMNAKVERISAVSAGVRDLREVIERAKEWQKINQKTLLIVDEIHRFNKSQQDVLLPHVEEGLVTLIGATTENPYFEVISALVSRAEIVRLEKLSDEDIVSIIKRANPDIPHEACQTIAEISGGDARQALNILERVGLYANHNKITGRDVKTVAKKANQHYDKKGDAHYDTISAFIKSMRGSDVDAALFYLFKMIASGEDPKFIMRRMYIFASEDIGNADPHALMLTASAARALEWVGLPEAEYSLAHCAAYMSAAPKSNQIKIAMAKAKEDVARHGNEMPPDHITNAPIEGLEKHGKSVGYQYPHDFPGGLVKQQYRPQKIQKNIYYQPGTEGFEKEIKRRLDKARKYLF